MDLPDGAIACGVEQACPPGLVCGGDGLCYRDPANDPDETPGDAGASDAARGKDQPDAEPGFRRCYERHPNALFCDDFESGGAAGWSGSSIVNAESTAVNGGVLGGESALELRGTSPASHVHKTYDLSPPVADGVLHARAYYFVPSGFVIDPWVVLFSMNPDPARAGDKISADVNTGDRVSLVNTVDPDRNGYFGDAVFPRDRWVCVELEMTYGAAGVGAARLRIDGTQVLATDPGDSTSALGGFERVWFGFASSSNNPAPPVVRLDEVVVARGPIGCD